MEQQRIIVVDACADFGDMMEPEYIESGTTYVQQSKSKYSSVVKRLHLIRILGAIGGNVETRILGAKDQFTCLLAMSAS